MPVDADQIAQIVRATVDLYRIAEASLLRKVTDLLAQDIDSEAWPVTRLAALGQLRKAAQDIADQLNGAAPEAIRQAVAEGYRRGGDSVLADLPQDEAARLGARQAAGQFARGNVVESIAAALVNDVGQRHSNVVRHVQDVYRQVIAAGTAASIAGGLGRREASQLAYQRFVDQGIASFVDQRGRTWRLSSYVEMGVRTVTQRAAVQGQTDRQQSLGLPFVMVSNESQECERCRPFEGQILRVGSGPVGWIKVAHQLTGEPIEIYVKATLDDARAAGFQHPNCRHSVRAYLPGVTRLPEQPTADPRGDEARQRQRAIERQIRRWKEREAGALTPAAKQAAAGKVKAWQGAMRSHLAAHPTLKRQFHREQIGAGNIPAGQRPATPPQPAPTPAPAAPPPLPRRTRVTQPPPRVENLASLLDVDMHAEANRNMVRDVFADIIGGDYAGFTVKVKQAAARGARTSRPGLAVLGEIFRDGKAVGRFERAFYRDRDGDLVVVHALLYLHKDYRGRGFAGEFNGHLERWYRQQGIVRIEVHANIDVGGYTWASQGFEFEDTESADYIIDRVRFMVDVFNELVDDYRKAAGSATAANARALRERARKLEAQVAEAADILERADGSQFGDLDFPTSYEISQVGRSNDVDDEKQPWLGKAAMLGSDWHGVKWL
ncbi:phage minor capsid protein [Actinoplanes sp. NPDC048796]|uniref:phage minor capsid protein n=1 Tax=Actinoplanes sp. NPDC048796 TaxID=3155640 RepID=UPI0033D25135